MSSAESQQQILKCHEMLQIHCQVNACLCIFYLFILEKEHVAATKDLGVATVVLE